MHCLIGLILISTIPQVIPTPYHTYSQANDAQQGNDGKRFNLGWGTNTNLNIPGLGNLGWGNGFNAGSNGYGSNNGLNWNANANQAQNPAAAGGVNWGSGANWGANGVNWGSGLNYGTPNGNNAGVNWQNGVNWNLANQQPQQQQQQGYGQAPAPVQPQQNVNNNNNNNGQNGNGVTQNCNNGKCQTCVNGHCYSGHYSLVVAYDKCPPAACEEGCQGLVFNTDNCPICRCTGYSTREPCSLTTDCKSPNGQCTSGSLRTRGYAPAAAGDAPGSLCRYAPVADSLPKYCSFAYECPETETCIRSRCQRDSANRRHLIDRPCVFQSNCPSGYTCDNSQMTCWTSGLNYGTPNGNNAGVTSNWQNGVNWNLANQQQQQAYGK